MTEKKVRICEVCQSATYLTEEKIIKALQRECIDKHAYILHDKDVYTQDDELFNPMHKAGTLKPPHWHVMIKFKFDDTRRLKDVANWFGVAEQYVNKSTRGNFDSMLLYLIHHKKFEKFQYSAKEVKANFDYLAFLENKNSKMKLSTIIELIDEGVMNRNNYTNYVNCSDFIKYRTQIDAAFRYYDDKNQSCDRNLDVIYISGRSGSGKTTLAKNICKKKKLTMYISDSGKDALSNYRDEDVIIFDDYRTDTMGFADFLKTLDNHTATRVASRYHNKDISHCSLIMVTSIFSPEQMFRQYCSQSGETIEQFKRRCKTWLDVKTDVIDVYVFNEEIMDYNYKGPLKKEIENVPRTPSKGRSLKEVQDFLGMEIQPPSAEKSDDADSDNTSGEIICPF